MQCQTHIWNSNLYNEKHAFVYGYGRSLLQELDPKPTERILDLGCGSGELTAELASMAGTVVGMDASKEMIRTARERFPEVAFIEGNANSFTFEDKFNAIFSNATLHWVTEAEETAKNMFENLHKGGRLVVEFGGEDNVRTIIQTLRKVLLRFGYKEQSQLKLWYFPSLGTYTSVLEKIGFKVSKAHWYDRPTELKDHKNGIVDWLSMFAPRFFEGVSQKDADTIKNSVQETLRESLFQNGRWYADYKRIRVVAHKQ